MTHCAPRRITLALVSVGLALALPVRAAEWDSIVGSVGEVGTPTDHWFTARGQHIGYLIDGDSGNVEGTLTLSLFSPALRADLARGQIHAYGSFYTRTYYGDRTDLVLSFDAKTMQPVSEVEIPPKAAGIGHGGMIGLIADRFIGVWNITPGMSVSIVDLETDSFVGEISTPGCAAIYPIGSGFLMPCGDGTLQYVTLDAGGKESARVRSSAFFSVDTDPIYDYAVPTADGWLFLSFDGQVFEAGWNGTAVTVSEPWSIFGPAATDDADEAPTWRIGGSQPFAYNAATRMLVTLMHEGGGQETFEDGGTEVWAFNVDSKRRGYKLSLGEDTKGSSLQLTKDEKPLLVVAPSGHEALRIYDGQTGQLQQTMDDMGVRTLQNL